MTLARNIEASGGTRLAGGSLLVGPQQYPSLAREKALADEFGLDLVVATDPETFRAAVPNAAVVLVTPYARLEELDFAAMQRCVAVVRYGIGYDNVDVEAARRSGVPVSIVPGAATEEVASHALAMGLALARRIPAGQESIAQGGWTGPVGLDTPRLSELEVGVVGMGRIGHQVASWYLALGCSVRAYDPIATFDIVPSAELATVLEQSHLVTLHLPLSADTHHLVSADVLSRMRRGAVIVNVSRGGLIDERALAAALKAGHIAGAGLDTFSVEPLPADDVLRTSPHVLLTPHTAWRSDKAMDALQEATVLRARQALSGLPIEDRVD